MSYITYLFIAVALISALNCAPVDDSTPKSPATFVSAPAPASGNVKKQDSDESKESSEEHKRQSRDTENSPAALPQDSSSNVRQSPEPAATRDAPKPQPQVPSRDTRDTDHEAALSPAVISASRPATSNPDVSTSSTSSSTTARSSY